MMYLYLSINITKYTNNYVFIFMLPCYVTEGGVFCPFSTDSYNHCKNKQRFKISQGKFFCAQRHERFSCSAFITSFLDLKEKKVQRTNNERIQHLLFRRRCCQRIFRDCFFGECGFEKSLEARNEKNPRGNKKGARKFVESNFAQVLRAAGGIIRSIGR